LEQGVTYEVLSLIDRLNRLAAQDALNREQIRYSRSTRKAPIF
jgi:hypothetical protein